MSKLQKNAKSDNEKSIDSKSNPASKNQFYTKDRYI